MQILETRQYRLTLRALDGDGYTIETQEAHDYMIHQSGYHLFIVRGRIVRAISNARVIEVKET